MTGLILFCKLISGLLTNNCKLILGRDIVESSVLRTNFSAKKPAHRQSAKRQTVNGIFTV
jgi:hypothetical protein